MDILITYAIRMLIYSSTLTDTDDVGIHWHTLAALLQVAQFTMHTPMIEFID